MLERGPDVYVVAFSMTPRGADEMREWIDPRGFTLSFRLWWKCWAITVIGSQTWQILRDQADRMVYDME